MMHQALDDSDQTRKYGISEPIIQALIMTLLQTMSYNIGLVSNSPHLTFLCLLTAAPNSGTQLTAAFTVSGDYMFTF